MRLINFSSRTWGFGKWVGQDMVTTYLLLVVDVWHHLPTIIPGWVVMNVTTYHLKQWRSTAHTPALCGLACSGLIPSLLAYSVYYYCLNINSQLSKFLTDLWKKLWRRTQFKMIWLYVCGCFQHTIWRKQKRFSVMKNNNARKNGMKNEWGGL